MTSIEGTQISLDANGYWIKPHEVWNESALFDAAAGDRTAVFSRPAYQNRDARVVRGSRGYPDVSLNAAAYESPIPYRKIAGLADGEAPVLTGSSARRRP